MVGVAGRSRKKGQGKIPSLILLLPPPSPSPVANQNVNPLMDLRVHQKGLKGRRGGVEEEVSKLIAVAAAAVAAVAAAAAASPSP